ncbi:MAG: hypothetical protein ABJC09_13090 [Terriglobia bacterium]
MNRGFLIAFGAVLMVAAAGIALWRPSARVQAPRTIGKVRAQKVDDNETILLLDFRLRNDSDRPKTVANVTARLDALDGSVIQGQVIGAAALANVFQNYPLLGGELNPPLKAMDDFKPGEAEDRAVGVRFDAPDEAIAKRKDVVLRVEFINGPIVEYKAP